MPMILFDLTCRNDHVFEAWFRDGAAFETQRKARKIICPECGEARVEKAPMAPRINKGAAEPVKAKAVSAPPDPKQAEMMQALRKLRQIVETNLEHVGPRFPEEARAIHYGEREKRGIYGEATSKDVEELAEEGIGVTSIPWVPRQDS
jgi:hypothetical protein